MDKGGGFTVRRVYEGLQSIAAEHSLVITNELGFSSDPTDKLVVGYDGKTHTFSIAVLVKDKLRHATISDAVRELMWTYHYLPASDGKTSRGFLKFTDATAKAHRMTPAEEEEKEPPKLSSRRTVLLTLVVILAVTILFVLYWAPWVYF